MKSPSGVRSGGKVYRVWAALFFSSFASASCGASEHGGSILRQYSQPALADTTAGVQACDFFQRRFNARGAARNG